MGEVIHINAWLQKKEDMLLELEYEKFMNILKNSIGECDFAEIHKL